MDVLDRPPTTVVIGRQYGTQLQSAERESTTTAGKLRVFWPYEPTALLRYLPYRRPYAGTMTPEPLSIRARPPTARTAALGALSISSLV
ncbi:hypothetical protein AC579_5964 [Pseudocercospora musae]|uniref:Uncharacterized protein n=1 Tax=Pseudocercospora musae TaxID=113226 RepID=A0A139IT56_9PEZI|nr:hypothetical protein AC579_5964 [Pseudocercospora musae]